MTYPGSPCRRGPGPRRHHCSWWHANLVESYRAAREAQRRRAEDATGGYGPELSDYWETIERPVTFGQWLAGYREGER